MAVKCVIFDFDGVISNTEESNYEFLQKALKEYGILLTDKEKYSLIGTSDSRILEDILRRSQADVSLEELKKKRVAIGNTYENTDIQPMHGLIPLLDILKKKQIQMAIATSTSTRLIMTALNKMHLISYFDSIVCGDMCANRKPDPEIYNKTMAYLGRKPEECIIIEDSTAGITAGKRAGTYVIAYSGSGILQDRTDADCLVETYDECQKVICDLLNN
ncbi:HAD family phosphatase [Lacrimispora sp.]|uniref:HAD family hydrolase n=1 Tax=Lacrimispora sp. TaxID=2719234 RepID=UPI0029E4CCDE|nr:hypothetical protein [Lacrimispora sp.]